MNRDLRSLSYGGYRPLRALPAPLLEAACQKIPTAASLAFAAGGGAREARESTADGSNRAQRGDRAGGYSAREPRLSRVP